MTVLMIAASMLLLFMAVPVFLVFGAGSAGAAILDLGLPWSTLIQVSYAAITKPVLIAIPLFIFSGLAMLRGGIASRLVHMTTTLVGHWPGGLAIGMVLTMGFFAAFCGSILAAITAVGTIMMPKMIEQGYPPAFVIVLAASAALLEALIPPSNAAIVFSALTSVPVSKTFAAGILPGLVLMVLLMILSVWRCRHIRMASKATPAEVWQAVKAAAPGLVTPVIILGGIYGGLLTPSETAAVAGIWAVLIGFVIHRELTIEGLLGALRQTAIATTVIFTIIAMAMFLSVILTYTRAPQDIIGYFTEFGVTPMMFWLMLAIICLILGTFIEIVPLFYLTVPIFAAIALSFNLNLLHLFVVFTAFAGIGMITPPVCVGIYTAAGVVNISPERAFGEIPAFVLMGIVYGALMIMSPVLSTWLPSVLF
ncbi:TRAP transporter large permease [Gammaproteobacteria bacterium]|jgi:tripartite ATP-independent transporter DctM subunit|nr:TRAP transporter large permease [Gammaproteobacteria bacterium]MDG2236913.1 TRAP transporter large permease [Arenicellales bacterium]